MRTFSTERTLTASRESIFAAFRNPETLARWWGPAGFTSTFHTFEFKPGGAWSFDMHGPEAGTYPNESRFEEIVDPGLIVIRHLSDPVFTLTVRIEEIAGGSIVHWIQEFASEETAGKVAHIVVPANEQNLDRLEAEVRG